MQEPEAEHVCHCGKRFTRIENLKRHQRSHTGTSTRDCQYCGRTFSRNDVLQRHLKTHVGHQVGDGRPRASPSPSIAPEVPDSRSIIHQTPQIQQDQIYPQDPLSANTNLTVQAGPSTGDSAITGPVYTTQQDEAWRILHGLLQATQPVSAPSYSLNQDVINPFPDMFSNQAAGPWDDGMLWSLQDQAPLQDFDWAMFGFSPQGTNERESIPTPAFATVPPSRAATPPVDQAGDNLWPTDYQPRPFVVGTSGHLEEVTVDPNEIPTLKQWSKFWLDREVYDRVITSLAFGQRLPNCQAFRMPSSLFTVNTLISHYFDKFLPQMPILHLPTFQMSSAPPLLIASIMMIGACLSNIKGSRPFSVDLIEVIRRTQVNLFEMDSNNLRNADLLHVSLLISFAGLWSGHQRSFELAELSRGMLINLSRRVRLLESPITFKEVPVISAADTSLSVRWQKWISAESKKRLGLAIMMFDALFPAFLDLPSYLAQGEMINTILPSDDRFWQAPTAPAWQAQLGLAPIPPAPYFSLGVAGLLVPKYAFNPPPAIEHLNPFASLIILKALYHHIWEFRSQLSVYQSLGVTVPYGEQKQTRDMENGFEGRKLWLETALSIWRREYYDDRKVDPLSQGGRTLYHLAFIALNTNLKDIYAISGKFGPHKIESVLFNLREWVDDPMSLRSASHAIQLLKVLDFPNHTPSIYAPISVFVAVMTLWTFTSIKSPESSYQDQLARLDSEDRGSLLTLFNNPSNLPEAIMRYGVRYLGGCKEWRIGAALALVLAKMTETRSSV